MQIRVLDNETKRLYVISEQRLELERMKQKLNEETEKIRLEQVALRQQHEQMLRDCQEQMRIQQSQFHTERSVVFILKSEQLTYVTV